MLHHVEVLLHRRKRLLRVHAHRHLLLHSLRVVQRVLAQAQVKHPAEPEEVKKVPRQGRDVGDVEGLELDAALEHPAEALRQRKRNLADDKAGEEEVDPARGEHVWDDEVEVLRQHAGHHGGVGQHLRLGVRLLRRLVEHAGLLRLTTDRVGGCDR